MASIFTPRLQSIRTSARRRKWGPAALVLALSFVLSSDGAAADDPPTEDPATPSNSSAEIRPELVVANELPTQRVSLDQALALAVQNNLGVEVARYEPLIAEQDMLGAWGAYDPVLSADFIVEETRSPNTFVLNSASSNRQEVYGGGASLSGLIPYLGATLGVEWQTSDTDDNSFITALRPRHDTSVFLTASIPLLRGLIWNEPWTQVKLTKLGYFTSNDSFREAVMNITEETVNAYWQLVADQEQYGVALKSLETALALLDQTETQYEVGVVSRVEVVEAEAGVADREFNLIRVRNQLENSGDNLIDAVLGRELKPTMSFRIEPADDPEDYEIREVNIERAVAIAIKNLPELSAANRAIEEREIDLKFAKNARLPRFDIDARYGYVQVSGDEVDPVNNPVAVSGGYQSSYDDLFSDDGFENYTVTGTFSIPIPNRAASRNVTRSEISLRRARTLKVRTEQDVVLAVRAAARGIDASARGIEAAERRRLAAEEQLRAERIRLEHGESTPFEVLQRESDLVDAESQKIAALQSYRAAEARLERAQGTILRSYRIELDDVRVEPMR